MEKKATIFDIGRFRNEDGPGIRTIIFFKGCPLSCAWCSNPFGLSPKPQLAVNKTRCTGCGSCESICPNGVNIVTDGKVEVNFSKCQLCGACIEKCPVGTRMISGKEYTAQEIFKEAYKDVAFYRKGAGGVTFSGGELLMQYEVAAEALRLCRKNYLCTCIETSAFSPWEHLKHVAQYCNFVFVDLKHMDSEKQAQFTGAPNQLILENIRKLCAYGVEKGVKVIVRRPVIPGFNDDEEDIIAAAKFVAELDGAPELNLLPYHNMGEAKYEMIGRDYTVEEEKMMRHSDPRLQRARELCEQYAPRNRISVGGDAVDFTR